MSEKLETLLDQLIDQDESPEYKLMFGQMFYGATGEGMTTLYYIDWADNEENFKQQLIENMNLHEYYHVGIEIFDNPPAKTPPYIKQIYNMLTGGNGYLKFEFHVNYS